MRRIVSGAIFLFLSANAMAQEDGAAAMAAALQDPLASISALITDNDIHIGTGTGEATTVLQLQPVYSISLDKVNLVPRAVMPIIGLAPGAVIPPVVDPAPDASTKWGLGDTAVQLFISPKSDSAWKWGIGPQVSVRTHSRSSHAGAGWGGGVTGVLVGALSENVSSAFIVGHMEGQNNFSVSMIQPMIYYNFPNVPGLSIGYSNSITYDHNISSGTKWQIPIGATIGRTSDLGGGYGLDLNIGAYGYLAAPRGGPDWSLKFGISLLFPKN